MTPTLDLTYPKSNQPFQTPKDLKPHVKYPPSEIVTIVPCRRDLTFQFWINGTLIR